MARSLSGEALVANVKCLLRLLESELEKDEVESLRMELAILRRDANRRRPPRQKAAQAVRLRELKMLLRRAKREKLSGKERQAFATMSRVCEIVTLEVDNVAKDGSAIALRPKTSARTWKRLVKRVTNASGLRAAYTLARYREEARRTRRRCLFIEGKGHHIVTSKVTKRLKELGRRLGGGMRITAHNARKGAAVEAVLAGTPLPVVRALGGWANINTLQAYVGEAIRRTTSLGEVLGETKAERKKEQGYTKHQLTTTATKRKRQMERNGRTTKNPKQRGQGTQKKRRKEQRGKKGGKESKE